MALRLAGEESGVQERIESFFYSPSVQDSGDLEAGTKTITATAKPGTPDYTASLTIPASPSSKLSVLRLGLRLQVTIDGFGGTPQATQLSYSVEVNGVERQTGAWTATGAQYAVVDLTSGQFNMGTPNEIKVYLWVNQGQAVVSLCQVMMAVGSVSTSQTMVLKLVHMGLLALSVRLRRLGTGTPDIVLTINTGNALSYGTVSGNDSWFSVPAFVGADDVLSLLGTVATDLNYIAYMSVNFRSLS